MSPLVIASFVISIITLLIGGAGVLPFLFKFSGGQAVNQERMRIMALEVAKHGEEIKANTQNQALTRQLVDGILTRFSKLDLIDTIAADIRHVRECLPTIMPRKEAEARIDGVERRVELLEKHPEEHTPTT